MMAQTHLYCPCREPGQGWLKTIRSEQSLMDTAWYRKIFGPQERNRPAERGDNTFFCKALIQIGDWRSKETELKNWQNPGKGEDAAGRTSIPWM